MGELNEEKMSTKVKKNQTAKVGEKYSYKYVDIAQIHDYLESINAKYIQKIQRIENDDYIMTKRFIDDKWEFDWIQGCKVVDATLYGVDNPAQQQGSALTYARRYSLLMAFGLATEDDDGASLTQPKKNKVDEITSKEQAENYKLSFGKFAGKTIKEIVENEKDYANWLYNNGDDTVKKCLNFMLEG